MGMQMATKEEMLTKTREADAAKRSCAMLQKRQTHYQELQGNWKQQLKQMEQAVLLCSQIHKRDRSKFMSELEVKDDEIMKLKAYVQSINQMRNRKAKIMSGNPLKSVRAGR